MSKDSAGFRGHALTLAAFLVVVLVWVGYILHQSGALPSLGHSYEVAATVPTASALTPGARVTVAGAAVGRVTNVKRAASAGPNAKLTLRITDDRVTPLPVDSTVQIRARSQVGENYVQVVVGNDRNHLIPDGGSVGLEQAAPFRQRRPRS